MKNIFNPRFVFITTLIILASVSRIIPHIPNFSPVAAIALFGGVCFSNKKLAFIVPLAIMFLSDVIIGFHNTMIYVYVAFIIISAIGIYMQEKRNVRNVLVASLISSILFFLITNFGVWASDPTSIGISGLIETYILGIPFFGNTILGDLFYNAILFGALYFAQLKFPRLARA